MPSLSSWSSIAVIAPGLRSARLASSPAVTCLVLGQLDERAHLGGRQLARAPRVAAAQPALGAQQLAERGPQLVQLVGGHATASRATSAGSGAREVRARRSTSASTIVGSSATSEIPSTHR